MLVSPRLSALGPARRSRLVRWSLLWCLLLSGCGDLLAEDPVRVDVMPSGLTVAVAKADGMSWDGQFGPLPALANNFMPSDPPPGVDPAERNHFTFEGAPDPFLELWQDDELLLTTGTEPTFMTSWYTPEAVHLNLTAQTRVTVRIWDRDEGAHDPIGELRLTGSDLLVDDLMLEFPRVGQARGFRLTLFRPQATP